MTVRNLRLPTHIGDEVTDLYGNNFISLDGASWLPSEVEVFRPDSVGDESGSTVGFLPVASLPTAGEVGRYYRTTTDFRGYIRAANAYFQVDGQVPRHVTRLTNPDPNSRIWSEIPNEYTGDIDGTVL